MQISVSSALTLYHDGQFWVGIVEHSEDGKLGVARIIFGAEPSDAEVLHFVVGNWENLVFFGNEESGSDRLPRNPKRRMREAAKALRKPAMSTKAQQAISAQRESKKMKSSRERSQRRQEEKQARFVQRSEKRKQKHRGH